MKDKTVKVEVTTAKVVNDASYETQTGSSKRKKSISIEVS